LRDPDQPGHRQVEHAERVCLADAEMNTKSGGRHHPPAEPGSGDRSFPVQEPGQTGAQCCAHLFPPRNVSLSRTDQSPRFLFLP
jgi:hypothetical protein